MAGDARERPIIFSAPMVRAILDGRKTMTRRIIKPQPSAGVRVSPFVSSGLEDGHGREVRIPWRPGDRAWVREAWGWSGFASMPPSSLHPQFLEYAATGARSGREMFPNLRPTPEAMPQKWRSPIHMPRWASRITLEITDVRVQRLQDISEEDARAEGAEPVLEPPDGGSAPHIAGFRDLWNSINGPDAWDRNPWVAALTFRRIEGDHHG